MGIFRRIGALGARTKLDREIEDEIRSHLAIRTADNLAAGMNRKEAARDARVRFGNPAVMKERVTSADAALLLSSLWTDTTYALRQLRKNPGFAFTAIVVLALGIGAATAIFAFVDAALIKPLPFREPSRLVSLYETVPNCPRYNISYENFRDWQKSDCPSARLRRGAMQTIRCVHQTARNRLMVRA